MAPRFNLLVSALMLLVGIPAAAGAQARDAPLSTLLPLLYAAAIDEEVDAFVTVLPEFGIFVDRRALEARALGRFSQDTFPIIKLAGNQLSSFPLASASGGFIGTLDTASGVFTRGSDSFGPIFAERPLTIGRKRLNVGVTFQRATFDHLEERSLRGGEIVSYIYEPLPDGDNIFFANALDLTLTTETLNTFATYGVTDRLDIGVAVPINRVDAHATLSARVGFTSIGITGREITYQTEGTASGVGDVVIRAKYNMLKEDTWGITEAVEVRLPTGDELDLLGLAGPQVKLTFIAAKTLRALSPHVNLAYTISGTSDAGAAQDTFVFPPSEEINYAVGADLAVSLRTTIAADIVGRVMRKAGTLTWGPAEFEHIPYEQFEQFDYIDGKDLHLVLGSVGLKANPFGNMLFSTNVLFPLTKKGLTDRLTWMVGGDYSF